MFTLPIGWSIFSQQENSLTALRPGHTTMAPRIAIFDRKIAQQNGNGFSVPSYRVRLISGDTDSEGNPVKERSLVEITVRSPMTTDQQLTVDSLAALAAMVGDPEFVDDATVDQMFPREAAGS